MILLIDNYDSFTYNLAQYIGNFAEVQVLRNDDPKLYEEAEKADGLVVSPGPGWPVDAGKMEDMIRDFAGKKPILGICLGHQAIAEVKTRQRFSYVFFLIISDNQSAYFFGYR